VSGRLAGEVAMITGSLTTTRIAHPAPKAGHVTGANHVVDGGRSAVLPGAC
jgi:hypothetical protein